MCELNPIVRELLTNPAFALCVRQSLDTPDLVTEFCRLYKIRLPEIPRTPIEQLIDKQTGYAEDKYRDFFHEFLPFVHRCVYQPMIPTWQAYRDKMSES